MNLSTAIISGAASFLFGFCVLSPMVSRFWNLPNTLGKILHGIGLIAFWIIGVLVITALSIWATVA